MKKYIIKKHSSNILTTKINYQDELNESQYTVVKEADGHCLVLAGAGSGKTRTLIYRVLYLLEKGVQPENIILVTFTNKAANEMRKRMEEYLGSSLQGLWCGTFHHIANKILRQNAGLLGIPASFRILDEEDSKSLLKSCYSLLPWKPSEMRFPQPSVLHKVMSYANNVQQDIQSVVEDKYPYFSHFEKEIKQISNEYQSRKTNSQSLDFDDLLLYWVRFMKTNTEFKDKLAKQFQFCLVDEYQDINALQNTIVNNLTSHYKNLLVVGDDAQSIYSFRGANIQNILSFPQEHENSKIFKLETNYRSTPEILTLSNRSIDNNIDQYKKELQSVRSNGSIPALIKVRNSHDQSMYVAQRIAELSNDGVSLNEIAVLFRARYQAAELELELSKRQIPYVLRGGVRFFEQAHIKDVLSFVRIVINPFDEVAWHRAVTMYSGIGQKAAHKLHEKLKVLLNKNSSASIKDILQNNEFANAITKRSVSGFNEFKKILNGVIDSVSSKDSDKVIHSVLNNGYINILRAKFDNAQDRIEDLHELANFAHTFGSISDFLSEVALKENFKGESFGGDAGNFDDEQCILTTIHQAKGLEWKIVFILSLSEGQFPHHQAYQEERQMEEERRLFYVAATRSRDELHMIHPMTRYDHDAGYVLNRISPFISELPETVYETVEALPEDDPSLDYDDVICIDHE